MGQRASAQQTDDNPNNPEATWWCKLLAKICGAFGGVVALITGIWTCVSTSPLCIIAGILMMIMGVLVLIFEVPLCCMFLDITKPVGAFAERRTFFQKALIFGIAAIIPFAMCIGVSTFLGCVLVFATGVIYGLMALGKKADRSQMADQAVGRQQGPGDMEAGNYDDMGNTALVNNQQQDPFAAQKPPVGTY